VEGPGGRARGLSRATAEKVERDLTGAFMGELMLVPVDAIVDRGCSIATLVYRAIVKRRAAQRFTHGAEEALTIGRRQLGLTGYRHRSDYADGTCHPDNLEGLIAVLKEEVIRAIRKDTLHQSANLEMDAGESMLLIGGPVWDGITRSIFGYQKKLATLSAPSESEYDCNGLAMHLPFRFDLDVNRITGRASRFVKTVNGITVEQEPNWGLIGRDRSRYYPTLRHDGFLATDYLLLTKIPNLLSDQTQGTERFVVNYAGTHGVAQRGVDLALSQQPLIRRIVEDLKIDVDRAATWPSAFQVIFRVGDIKHDWRRISKATDVRLVCAVRIDESLEWWAGWRRQTSLEMPGNS
jgi:hypothetical protein